MKSDLMAYLKTYGKKSFHEVPFSAVDALALCQLSYLKMKGIVSGFNHGEGLSWKEIKNHPEAESMFSDKVYGSMYRDFFTVLSESRRFQYVRVNYFEEWLDEAQEGQFAAVTFFLGKTSIFIAIRGTDASLTGWKENFNMGYMQGIPAQRKALAYLKGVARYTDGRMILGGHSKGGNIAVFAASRVSPVIQQRIRRIYSFDAPGLWKNFYLKSGYHQIEEKIFKVIPERSVIGMLMESPVKCRIVKSCGKGLLQHDFMNWVIRDGKFVYCRSLYPKSQSKVQALNQWIYSMSGDQARIFVDTLFDALRFLNVSNIYDLAKWPLHKLYGILIYLHSLEKEKKQAFLKGVWELIKIALK